MEYKESVEDLSPVSVKVTRSECRNGKIIIVFEPDLLSNKVFAPNAYYTDGDDKNKLQSTHFDLKVIEEKGEVKVDVKYANNLVHFTKGHRQICEKFDTSVFICKKEKAIHEILTIDERWYRQEGRIDEIFKMWDHDVDFQNHLKYLCKIVEGKFKDERLKLSIARYEEALILMKEANGDSPISFEDED